MTSFINHSGALFLLTLEILRASVTRPFYPVRFFEQILQIGFGSLLLIIVVGLACGLVMTLNFGHGLAKFGGIPYVPAMVSLSIVRGLAPLFTALLISGRVGSKLAAVIGAMNVTHQIDAIRALGTCPIRTLIVPRFWALAICLPLLSSLASVLGILAGFFVCYMEFKMPSGFYFNKALSSVTLQDFLLGFVKSFFFGCIIGVIGCYKGMTTTQGTSGIGKSTTWSVVTSSVFIMVFDFIITKIFILIFK